jgi:hypothetical protein
VKVTPSVPLDTITLMWKCDGCDTAIEDGDGHIEVSHDEVNEAQMRWKEGKKAHVNEHGWEVWSVGDLMEMPRAVRWHAWHSKCDPDRNANVYWIAIERVRTLAGLLDLHGHMSQKNWTKYTDFDDIRRHLPDLYGSF